MQFRNHVALFDNMHFLQMKIFHDRVNDDPRPGREGM